MADLARQPSKPQDAIARLAATRRLHVRQAQVGDIPEAPMSEDS